MATETIIKCDRCGETIDSDINHFQLLYPPHGSYYFIIPPQSELDDVPINGEDPIGDHELKVEDLHMYCIGSRLLKLLNDHAVEIVNPMVITGPGIED